jgi:hypothetical protein
MDIFLPPLCLDKNNLIYFGEFVIYFSSILFHGGVK